MFEVTGESVLTLYGANVTGTPLSTLLVVSETPVGEKLHAAQHLLDEVRAALDEAKDAMEDDAEEAAGFTVQLV